MKQLPSDPPLVKTTSKAFGPSSSKPHSTAIVRRKFSIILRASCALAYSAEGFPRFIQRVTASMTSGGARVVALLSR